MKRRVEFNIQVLWYLLSILNLRWSIRVKIRITLGLCKKRSRQQPGRHLSYATLPLLAGLKLHIISTSSLMIRIFYACQLMLNKFGLAGLREQLFWSLDEFLISNIPLFQQVSTVDGQEVSHVSVLGCVWVPVYDVLSPVCITSIVACCACTRANNPL